MSLILLLLLLLVGVGLSRVLVEDATGTERVGYALVGALSAVPLLSVHAALVGRSHIDGVTIAVVAGLLIGGMTYLRERIFAATTRWSTDDAVHLGIAGLGAAAIAAHHHHADFLIGVASYLGKGETECFYMQSFELFGPLNTGVDSVPLDTFFGIASTPGNTLFTSTLLSVFGVATFRVLHAAFAMLLVLFVQAILRRWGLPVWIAAAAGLWAVLNPWFLFVEVLDRNVIALALSGVLVHALLFHPARHALHGLLFGLTAGAGLRVLGLLWILPVALLKGRRGGWVVFAAAFAFVFAVNLPHLQHHGFHSLGETEPLWRLALDALSGTRTPFLPLASGPYHVVHGLVSLGVLGAALSLGGAFANPRRRETLALALLWLLPLAVVATQRDWVQVDKTRIGLAGSLWVPLLAGVGIDALRTRRWKPLLAGLLICAALPPALSRLPSEADPTADQRHPVYQHETPAWTEHARTRFADVGLLPGYARLWHKLDWSRKRVEERVVSRRLFPASFEGARPELAAWLFGEARPDLPGDGGPPAWTDVTIDLDALVTDPSNAVTLSADRPLLDLSKPESVLDIHFQQARVAWQREPLGVAILPGGDELGALRELYVDLNAFLAYGADDLGFQRVDLAHHALQPGGREHALRNGMTALPWGEDRSTLELRVPSDVTIVLRWWLVDGWTGLPHRVEAWSIEGLSDGDPRAVWHPLEPESYL